LPDPNFTPAEVDVTVDPSWLLAPLFFRDFLRLELTGLGPGRLVDQPPAERLMDPWLMHSVRPDRSIALTAAIADWPAWWEQALDHRPTTNNQGTSELIAFSPALGDLWPQVRNHFRRWTQHRLATAIGPDVEHAALAEFADHHGRLPAVKRLTVLVVPVTGSLFVRPEPDRLVVSAQLRRNLVAYKNLLDAVLLDFF